MTRAPKRTRRAIEALPPAADADAIIQVKVWLLSISPMVWRRLMVPSTCTLRELHGVIQVAMGWVGLGTRVVAVLIAGLMLVSVAAHWHAGFYWTESCFEYPQVLLLLALAAMLRGGRAIDGPQARRGDLNWNQPHLLHAGRLLTALVFSSLFSGAGIAAHGRMRPGLES